jgi:1-phosphatidylinositol phosphodiesterase
VEGMNSRVGTWLLSRLTASNPNVEKERARWSIQSDESNTLLLNEQVEDEPKRPVRGWVLMDYFAEPNEGLVPLLVENNFIGR